MEILITKHYKLIREYPGSPELGTIAEKSGDIKYILPDGKEFFESSANENLFKKLIENQPEFWQEVVEKDYEILSLLGSNNKVIPNLTKTESIDFLAKCGFEIHSVKRLSDGEIFTIGDKINISNELKQYYFTITHFQLSNDLGCTIHFCPANNKPMRDWASLPTISHIKQPLFTTEDGVDIFEGDSDVNVYYCNRNGFKLEHCCKKHILPGAFSKNNLYFKSKEKAEEYILMNKPCLSINDILSFTFPQNLDENKYKEKLKQLVKSKL